MVLFYGNLMVNDALSARVPIVAVNQLPISTVVVGKGGISSCLPALLEIASPPLLGCLYYSSRGHSVSTYAQRGEGVKQKRTPCVQGRGAYTWEYVRKNFPFCTCFVIFSYAGSFYHTLLSLA